MIKRLKITMISAALGLVLAICLLAMVIFDRLAVQPVVYSIRAEIVAAKHSECQPPALISSLLQRAYPDRIPALLVARYRRDSARQQENLNHLQRQMLEFGMASFLSLHLSQQEINCAFLATSYMGPELVGFENAALHYFALPLTKLNAEQAAKLVAISAAPSALANNPQRLEKRASLLLALPAN